jgi:hypothetical protein
MATTLSPLDLDTRKPSHWRIAARGWLREPLLHFVALGTMLFAVDHLIHGRAGDPQTIVVGPDVESEARELFKASRGHEPNEAELKALTAVWLDNEVLYREGLAMQVDRGDSAIRERVIFKALSVVDANVKLPGIDDTQLRAWFESRRAKYDAPARYSFREAALDGASSEAKVRSFVAALNAGTPGDSKAGLRLFKDRPVDSLVQSYGPDFPRALADAPPGEWRAIAARDGWHALLVDSISAAVPANFEALRDVILQDWKDAAASELRSAAVRAMAKKYTIRYEPAAP